MKPIATINGVPVYSNKRVSGIVNFRINFADGSYADVSKMEVVNKGEGYITLKNPPSEEAAGESVTKTETYAGASLSVDDVDATVDIQPGDAEGIVVTISGPKSAVASVQVRNDGDALVITGSGETGHSGSISMSLNNDSSEEFVSVGRGISISRFARMGNTILSGLRGGGNSIVNISMGSGEPAMKISIKVPMGLPVSTSGVSGALTIGDTNGSLVLHGSGQSKARVGTVSSAQLSASGQAEINVRGVSKSLSVNTSGQSDVTVSGGKVDTLAITSSGQSEVAFGGEATDATLVASGQSEVDVTRVINRPMRTASGQAEITVRNRD